MRLIVALSLALLFPSAASADEALQLVLSTREQEVRVGRAFTLELALRGPSVARLVSGTPGLQEPTVLDPDQRHFVYRFTVRTDKQGPLTLGPYQLELGGRTLRSNPLTVEVRPDEAKITLRVDAAAVTVGGTFQVTTESITGHAPEMAKSDAYEVENVSTSTDMTTVHGVWRTVVRKTFVVRALRKGVLKLGAESLTGLPSGTQLGTAVVEVK